MISTFPFAAVPPGAVPPLIRTMSKTTDRKAAPAIKRSRNPKQFYRDVMREMKHVNWPSQKETTRLTGVVLGVCLMVIILLWLLSTFFGLVLDQI